MDRSRPDQGRKATFLCCVVFLGLLIFPPTTSLAATPEGDITEPETRQDLSPLLPSPISIDHIKRAQTALQVLDLYKGNITGEVDALTERAIREYQQRKGLTMTGIITEDLVEELETAVNVIKLLGDLSAARKSQTDRAREALLSHPATRDLIEESLKDEVADAARDPSKCFNSPTVRCLLDEALENAKAVPKDDMRDWAFGELLVAQARAGLSDEARDTVRRISDPRLIISSLGQIAEAQAISGRDEEALAAASIIPDVAERVEAYANIAEITADAGRTLSTTAALANLRVDVRSIPQDARRISLLAKSATILHRLGFERDAAVLLDSLKDQARLIDNTSQREIALRHTASALAATGDITGAGNVLSDISSDSERAPVMISTAETQMRNGEKEKALETANAIKENRFRTVVLASLASARAKAGNRRDAFRILETADKERSKIRFPFARDYAASQIALAYATIGATGATPDAGMFLKALQISEEIKDDRLRAETAWLISFAKHDSGANGMNETQQTALADIEDIKSVPTQAWLLAELSENRASAGQTEWAWDLFGKSLEKSISVKNPWGRARSLARLAQSLIYLAEASAPPPEVISITP